MPLRRDRAIFLALLGTFGALTTLDAAEPSVDLSGYRDAVAIGEVTIGPFAGDLQFTIYRGAPLVHVEMVVHTQEDRRAILYDTGLAFSSANQIRLAWMDTEGKLQRVEAGVESADRPL